MLYHDDDLRFKVLSVGNFSHADGEFFVQARQYAALSLRLRGYGSFLVGDIVHISHPGDVLFIPAGLAYRVTYTDSESIAVHLTECDYPHAEFYQHCTGMEMLFEELREHWKRHELNRVKAGIYEILAQLQETRDPIIDAAVLRCKAYIDRFYSRQELRLADVCRQQGISESSFRRKFCTYYGISPVQYLIKLRMQHAATLLAAGRHRMKDVAQLCGFSDEKYFSRAFRAYYEKSPSVFSKRIKM